MATTTAAAFTPDMSKPVEIKEMEKVQAMDLKRTSRILFNFSLVTVFLLIFCFLILPDSAEGNGTRAASAESSSGKEQSILEQSRAVTSWGRIVYGKSGLGANLVCYQICPEGPIKRNILMTFEVHGYEDLFPGDGKALVNMGNSVADYFIKNRGQLQNCRLFLVASANPDGLSHGKSKDGIGRCQASLGVNINRDFDFNFIVFNESRDHTLSAPFAAPETRALRDLVNAVRPDIVIDCHGWENHFIGDHWLAGCFRDSLGISRINSFDQSQHGYFSAWAGSKGIQSMLIEYPTNAARNSGLYAGKTITGIRRLVGSL